MIGTALAGDSGQLSIAGSRKTMTFRARVPASQNQRDMLEKFCEKQGWEVAAVYQDDGFTGLNMERPDLKRMLKAIERKQITLSLRKIYQG